MLVVICAIRKCMECIFTKRELKLLDDLLPESNKNIRKGGRQKAMIRQLSKKISKHNMVKEWNGSSDIETKEEALKREKVAAKTALKKKAKELGLEVDQIVFKDPKVKASKNKLAPKSATLRRLSADSKIENLVRSSRSKSPPVIALTPQNKCTLFVKMPESMAYLPITMRRKTVQHLLQALSVKCANFQSFSVVGIYQKNKHGMLFHLDDDMMEYLENQQIFNVELVERSDDPTKFDMTLIEVKPNN